MLHSDFEIWKKGSDIFCFNSKYLGVKVVNPNYLYMEERMAILPLWIFLKFSQNIISLDEPVQIWERSNNLETTIDYWKVLNMKQVDPV